MHLNYFKISISNKCLIAYSLSCNDHLVSEPMDHVFMFANKLVDMRIRQHGYQADQALQGKIYVLKQNMHPHIEIKSDIQPGS